MIALSEAQQPARSSNILKKKEAQKKSMSAYLVRQSVALVFTASTCQRFQSFLFQDMKKNQIPEKFPKRHAQRLQKTWELIL